MAGGWLLHDLVTFTTRGEPQAVLELVPGSTVVVLAAGILGFAMGREPKLLFLLVALSGLASVLPSVVDIPVSRAYLLFPRAVFLLGLAGGACAIVQRRWRLGHARLGLCMGLLACVAKNAILHAWSPRFVALAAPALVILALGFVRRASPRRIGTVLVVASVLALVAHRGYRMSQPSRPDLAPVPTRSSGPNLILIVLDTVAADHLAPYGYERVTTPGLDRFVEKHATLFTEARSTSPFTLASHGSLFTGLYPSEHGAARPAPSSNRLRDDVPTLAERLRREGYLTAAIVANTTYLGAHTGLDRGFEHFDDRRACAVYGYVALPQMLGYSRRTGNVVYRDARKITDLALRWLASSAGAGAYFLTLNYLDAHAPYAPPPPFDRAFAGDLAAGSPELGRPIRRLLYDRELAYLDSQVTRLLEALEERGDFDRTMVIITSDHGEALGRHGVLEHCWDLYEALVHVPLYVKPLGARSQRVDTRHVTGADVHDLALNELGISMELEREVRLPGLIGEWYPTHPLSTRYVRRAKRSGKDLDRDLISWLEGRTKFIVSSKGLVEAYDLDQDPLEKHPLGLSEEQTAAALRRARRWWDAHPISAAPPAELDEDQRMRLEALGYGGG